MYVDWVLNYKTSRYLLRELYKVYHNSVKGSGNYRWESTVLGRAAQEILE